MVSMKFLSEQKDEELKEELKDSLSVHTSWGAGRIDMSERLTFYWPYDQEEYSERVRRTSEFLEGLKYMDLYAVAFSRDQYAEYDKTFERKYNNKSVELSSQEIVEVDQDLIEFIIIPESMDWAVIFDHEGDISFNGDKAFIRQVKQFFDDWEDLSEVPEKRSAR